MDAHPTHQSRHPLLVDCPPQDVEPVGHPWDPVVRSLQEEPVDLLHQVAVEGAFLPPGGPVEPGSWQACQQALPRHREPLMACIDPFPPILHRDRYSTQFHYSLNLAMQKRLFSLFHIFLNLFLPPIPSNTLPYFSLIRMPPYNVERNRFAE
jgi:hypothetical protein